VRDNRSSLREWFAGLLAAPRYGWSFAAAGALVIAAIAIGLFYVAQQRLPGSGKVAQQTSKQKETVAPSDTTTKLPKPEPSRKDPKTESKPDSKRIPERKQLEERGSRRLVPREGIAGVRSNRTKSLGPQPDVFSSEIAYSDLGDPDTQRHVERAEMLLRSIRNADASGDDAIDVSYEKASARQLLSENLVLRQNAEDKGRFPVKSLLSSLEPFLIDIANLPDHAKADDLRAVKDRVTRTEIVAVLQSY